MEATEILRTVFEIVGIPLLGAITAVLVKWLNSKAEEIKAKTNNAYAQKYLSMLNDTITSAVIAINQTYVNTLKEVGKFDEEAQKAAFEKVSTMVMNSLTEDAVIYLREIIGDLETYISNKIEEKVVIVKE